MADFDKSKFDPKAAAEARKQEMDQMAQKLEAGVKDVFQGEKGIRVMAPAPYKMERAQDKMGADGKPVLDMVCCEFMCQEINEMKKKRKEFFKNFNIDAEDEIE